jgi:hypothetical protein
MEYRDQREIAVAIMTTVVMHGSATMEKLIECYGKHRDYASPIAAAILASRGHNNPEGFSKTFRALDNLLNKIEEKFD